MNERIDKVKTFSDEELGPEVQRLTNVITELEKKIKILEESYANHQHGGIDGSQILYNYPIKLNHGNYLQIGKFKITDDDYNEDNTLFWEDGNLYYRGDVTSSTGTQDVQLNSPFILGNNGTQDVTISSGSITATSSLMIVDTQNGDASDDLDTITTSNVEDGTIVVLMAESSSRTVVVKDGTGNLHTVGDMSLDNDDDTITLINVLSQWYEIARSNNAA